MSKKILSGIIIILIIPIIAAGFWYGKMKVMKQQIKIDNRQSNSENRKVSNNSSTEEIKPEEQLIIQEGKCRDDDESDSKEMFFYCIPEMGIKFKVDKVMKNDLVYIFKENVRMVSGENAKVAFFSSKSLIQKEKYCEASKGPLGVVARVEKKTETNDDFLGASMVKEFKDFFTIYVHPQAVCSDNEDDFENIEQPQLIKFQEIFKDTRLLN